MDFNENFILGCSAIGAGLAVIAGIGPGVGPEQSPRSLLPCYWDRQLPRPPVCTVC